MNTTYTNHPVLLYEAAGKFTVELLPAKRIIVKGDDTNVGVEVWVITLKFLAFGEAVAELQHNVPVGEVVVAVPNEVIVTAPNELYPYADNENDKLKSL